MAEYPLGAGNVWFWPRRPDRQDSYASDCLFDEISSGLHQVCKILIYKQETSRMTDTHSIIFLAKIYADLVWKIDVIQLSLSSVNRQIPA